MTAARLRLAAQIAAVVIVAALLGLLGWKLARGESEVTSELDRGGSPVAPAFTLERLDGKGELELASLRGKAVVLNFWASWCGPCKDETPLLQEGWKRWQDKGVVFVGIDVKDFRGDARDFLARYGVTGFPETYFVDAAGNVRSRIAGPVEDAEELDAGIERALAPA